MEELRYPIGRFEIDKNITAEKRQIYIQEMADAPAQLRAVVAGLNDEQLDTRYRPDGWTVRQVVHHVPDSHLNSYIRYKWALTEDVPLIKTYHEDRWAELYDGKSLPVDVSLNLLDAIHERYLLSLRALPDADFKKQFKHADWGTIDIDIHISIYAWHGKHHVAHITNLRERMGW